MSFFCILKRVLFDENNFLSIQLLFTWFFFKVLGFLKIPLNYRILFSIVTFLILLHYWQVFVSWFFNNMIIQCILYTLIYIIDCLIIYGTIPFWIFVIISFCSCIYSSHYYSFLFDEKTLIFPNIEIIMILLFLFSFIRKIMNFIVYSYLKTGFYVTLRPQNLFSWEKLIAILNNFFIKKLKVKNKICFEKLLQFPFRNYPFSDEVINWLIKPENDVKESFFDVLEKNDKDFDTIEAHLLNFLEERKKKGSFYASKYIVRNNTFFFLVAYGLLFGFCLSLIYLNLI